VLVLDVLPPSSSPTNTGESMSPSSEALAHNISMALQNPSSPVARSLAASGVSVAQVSSSLDLGGSTGGGVFQPGKGSSSSGSGLLDTSSASFAIGMAIGGAAVVMLCALLSLGVCRYRRAVRRAAAKDSARTESASSLPAGGEGGNGRRVVPVNAVDKTNATRDALSPVLLGDGAHRVQIGMLPAQDSFPIPRAHSDPACSSRMPRAERRRAQLPSQPAPVGFAAPRVGVPPSGDRPPARLPAAGDWDFDEYEDASLLLCNTGDSLIRDALRMDPEFVSTLIAEREYRMAFAEARARATTDAAVAAAARADRADPAYIRAQQPSNDATAEGSPCSHQSDQQPPAHFVYGHDAAPVHPAASVTETLPSVASAPSPLPAPALSPSAAEVHAEPLAVPSHDFYGMSGWDALAESKDFMPLLMQLDPTGCAGREKQHNQLLAQPLDPADLAHSFFLQVEQPQELHSLPPPPQLPQFLFTAQPISAGGSPRRAARSASPQSVQLQLELDASAPVSPLDCDSLPLPLPPGALFGTAALEHASSVAAASPARGDGKGGVGTGGTEGASLLKARSQSLVPPPFRFATAQAVQQRERALSAAATTTPTAAATAGEQGTEE